MARGINKIILVGNVGNTPEVRYMPNGNAVTTLSIATNDTWKDKKTGNKQERTEWHRVICFNRLGEIARDYVQKGTKLYVEGSLRTRKWQDSQGQDHYTTEVVANDIQMLDGKNNTATTNDEDVFDSSTAKKQQIGKSAQTAPVQIMYEAFDELDVDIPF